MHMEDKRPDIARSALLIVDMQNDFCIRTAASRIWRVKIRMRKSIWNSYEAPSRKWCGWQKFAGADEDRG